MKLAIVAEELNLTSGAAVAAINMATAASRQGFEVVLVHTGATDSALRELEEQSYTNLGAISLNEIGNKQLLRDLALKNKQGEMREVLRSQEQRLVTLLNEFRPHAIHFHNYEYVCRNWIVNLLAHDYRVSITAHDLFPMYGYHYRWLHRGEERSSQDRFSKILAHQMEVLNNVTVVCPSRWISNFARSSEITSSIKTVVSPNFPRAPLGSTSRVTRVEGDYFFLPIARINDSRKGFDVGILGFLNFIGRTADDNHALIVGTEQRLGMEKLRIFSIGDLMPTESGEEGYDFHRMSSIMSRSKGVIIPSRVENFANVGVEAVSVGTKLIVSNVGGNPELIEELSFSRMFSSENHGELGLEMCRLSEDHYKVETSRPLYLDEEVTLNNHLGVWMP